MQQIVTLALNKVRWLATHLVCGRLKLDMVQFRCNLHIMASIGLPWIRVMLSDAPMCFFTCDVKVSSLYPRTE